VDQPQALAWAAQNRPSSVIVISIIPQRQFSDGSNVSFIISSS
jgi:hypothetical protein